MKGTEQFMFFLETSSKLLTGSRSLFWEDGEGSARYFWRTSLRCGQFGRILIGPLGCMLWLVRVTQAIRGTSRGMKATTGDKQKHVSISPLRNSENSQYFYIGFVLKSWAVLEVSRKQWSAKDTISPKLPRTQIIENWLETLPQGPCRTAQW